MPYILDSNLSTEIYLEKYCLLGEICQSIVERDIRQNTVHRGIPIILVIAEINKVCYITLTWNV